MIELLVRFVIGGVVVSAFAVLADMLNPKSFAGLFGAAPSVALATLGLTIATQGASYATSEAYSMMAGAIAFFLYASLVSTIMMRYKPKALLVAVGSIPVWVGAAFAIWRIWLK